MELLSMCGCKWNLLFLKALYTPLPRRHIFASSRKNKTDISCPCFAGTLLCSVHCSKFRIWVGRPGGFPETGGSEKPTIRPSSYNKEGDRDDRQRVKNKSSVDSEPREATLQDSTSIISACIVGLLTGIGVVLFNMAVHEIRDLCWDGFEYQGASWLREEPIGEIYKRVIFVPACGGLTVGMLNIVRDALEDSMEGTSTSKVKAVFEPILKALAACVTLGTGNSLGPEGPSVEIGASIAKGVGTLFNRHARRRVSLKAAGSAAGIASGFSAPVAGCFFAVESVLWPSPLDASLSQTNTTSMVILSAVIASVVSEIGLGSEPAFVVPAYDFRSPGELPLYLLLGVLCGLVSLTLSRCTTLMLAIIDNIRKATGMPKPAFPVLGGFAVGFIALQYPEILYWGFENVDVLLESRPFVKGLPSDILLQLVAVKIIATSLCRASGLVGGYYAPSLFIGAATGMAYGKFLSFAVSQSNPIFHLSILEVASPQAYGLVGMAASLAGVCQVPLTSVLLLFELTQDYRILLPLLGAVGLSSWITSGNSRRSNNENAKKLGERNSHATQQPETASYNPSVLSSASSLTAKPLYGSDICKLDSSLCLDDPFDYSEELARRILVSEAMRTRFATVLMSTSLMEAVTFMLAEKQSCAVIVDDNGTLIGLLTLGDIEEFSTSSKAKGRRPEELLVSELCSHDEKCQVLCTVTPAMTLFAAQTVMNRFGINQLPVVLEQVNHLGGLPVGLLDKDCIILACRVSSTRDSLSQFSRVERESN